MLQVSLLGQFEVRRDGALLSIPTRNAQALFAFLLLNAGQAQRRERLAGLLWPDSSEENARSNLRHELWRLRKALAGEAAMDPDLLLVNDLTITFDAAGEYTLDVLALQRATPQGSNVEQLMAALDAYRGPLLPGFYQEWVFAERARLQAQFEARMARLLQLLQDAGRWADLQEWGTRWIALDESWPETAYRALIAAYAAGGDMSRAVSTYERLALGLQRELGLVPSPQTRALLDQVHATSAAGSGAGQSPLAAAPVRPTHLRRVRLPRPLTSFVGREREMAHVQRLVLDSRLVTITGPGGVGKTRLAIEAAAALLSRFEDGALWVELASLPPGEDLVARAIARALRVPEAPGVPTLDAVLDRLQEEQVLLVLDNCEHIIAFCATLVERLLSDCPRLTILATSREPLAVSGEKAWTLPSLSLPLSDQAHKHFAQAEAVQLFLERAADVRPAYQPSHAESLAIAHICLRLDGIPLAIELAAARMNMLSAEEIAARLDSRFILLTAGRRTALARHQTLQAAIAWSFDLLTPAEQCLFRRLTVFAGSFTLQAAESVCAGDNGALAAGPALVPSILREEVLDVLGRLLHKSLLQVAAGLQHPDLATRYQFLETIRDFGRIKLHEADETGTLTARHARYFVQLVETSEPHLLSKEQGRYYRLLQAEAGNIRAVIEWAAAADAAAALGPLDELRVESGLRIAGALLWFWWSHFSPREGLDMTLKVLALPPQPNLDKPRARSLNTAGYLYWVLGEPLLARQCIEQALSILERSADDGIRAWSQQFLGLVLSAEGSYELAHEAMLEGLALARNLGDLNKSSFTLAFRGDVALQQGDRLHAERIYKECAQELRELGNTLFTAYPLRRLGYLALERNEIREAWSCFLESLVLNQEGGDRRAVLACVVGMAVLALSMEQPLKAAQLLGTVEGGLDSLDLTLLHLDEIELQRLRFTLQEKLDAGAFSAALAQGWDLHDESAGGLLDAGYGATVL